MPILRPGPAQEEPLTTEVTESTEDLLVEKVLDDIF
jgi:hypothetical protein